ncbi:hypothetical protein E4U43_001257 [Claviceps pusilla]|uniref:Uncharacterized protein n=1 Tax=Claviceps pusilla TaxID=123648 RepID=A0A9P7SYE0_9HYPO|nr:hypothetical protein E4U43_001257 [Claviceps pusilla]
MTSHNDAGNITSTSSAAAERFEVSSASPALNIDVFGSSSSYIMSKPKSSLHFGPENTRKPAPSRRTYGDNRRQSDGMCVSRVTKSVIKASCDRGCFHAQLLGMSAPDGLFSLRIKRARSIFMSQSEELSAPLQTEAISRSHDDNYEQTPF